MSAEPTPPRHRGKRITIKGILASTAAVTLGVGLAVAAAGGSYALWNDKVPVSAGTITTGSIGLTVNGVASAPLTATTLSNMLPGETANLDVTLKNTGSVRVTLAAAVSSSIPFVVTTRAGLCSATGTPLGELASGASLATCVTVSLPATTAVTAQGSSTPFTVTYTATQKVS